MSPAAVATSGSPRPAASEGAGGGGASQWWLGAPVVAPGAPTTASRTAWAWYRLGDGWLAVQSADAPFAERVAELYRDCATTPPPADAGPIVWCEVRVEGAHAVLTLHDGEPLDQVAFALDLFADRGFGAVPGAPAGWQALQLGTEPAAGTVLVAGDAVIAPVEGAWRSFAGSLAVSRLFARQGELVFLHAASVSVRGTGMLLIGPKGAGKTTLALALGARGHDCLGDEIAAVRLATHELVPVRRSLAVRDGPRAAAVAAALGAAPRERFPDGSHRTRSHASVLFPGPQPAPAPLRHVVFLRGMGPAPVLTARGATRADLGALSPLGATLWGRPPFQRARDLLGLLARASCHDLILGDPDDTAARLDQLTSA